MSDTSRRDRILWYVVIVFAATMMACFHMANNTPYKLAAFNDLVHFQAAEPFQHRILVPAAVAVLQHIVPLGDRLLFTVFAVIEWSALILVAERALTLFDIGRTTMARRALALTLLMPMYLLLLAPNLVLSPVFAVHNGVLGLGSWKAGQLFYYVYDVPAAFFTLAMTLVLIRYADTRSRRGLILYFALFVLATFNRETSAFMVPVFALLLYRRMPLRPLLAWLALQCVLFIAIQGGLGWLFADNINPNSRVPGTGYENHLLLNLDTLAQPAFLVTFLPRFAAGLWLPVLLRYRLLDGRLAVALIGFGGPFLCLALFGGVVREYRIFIELMPLIWLAALQVIAAPQDRGCRHARD